MHMIRIRRTEQCLMRDMAAPVHVPRGSACMQGVTVHVADMSELLSKYPAIMAELVQLLNQPPNRMNIGGADGCAARHG